MTDNFYFGGNFGENLGEGLSGNLSENLGEWDSFYDDIQGEAAYDVAYVIGTDGVTEADFTIATAPDGTEEYATSETRPRQSTQTTLLGHEMGAAESMPAETRHDSVRSARARYQVNSVPISRLYRENIRKRDKRRKFTALKLFAVCFGSAVLGGALVLGGIALLSPTAASSIFGLSRDFGSPVSETVKTFAIEKVDSPVEAVYEKVSQSVVGIVVTASYGSYSDFFFGSQETTSEASGIIFRSDGFILTSDRVLTGGYSAEYIPSYPGRGGDGQSSGGGGKIEVILPGSPDTPYEAKIISQDSRTGVAVIKIDAVNLPVPEFGDSDRLKLGELVVAVGNTGDGSDRGPVTDGIVSGLSSVNTENGVQTSLISTSALINQNNIGGALANAAGQIVGINVIRADRQFGDGMGFAIPIKSAVDVADNLIEFNYVRGRAKTGMTFNESYSENIQYYRQQLPGLPEGAYVEDVEPISGAYLAGIMSGDIVTEFNGVIITDYRQIEDAVDLLAPGETVYLRVYRDGEELGINLELSEERAE